MPAISCYTVGMAVSKYNLKRIRETLVVSLLSAATGVAFASFLKYALFNNAADTPLARFMLLGGLTGGFLSLTFILIEDKLELLFGKPLWVVLVAIPLIYTGIIAVEYGVIFSAVIGFENFFGESLILETIIFSLAMSLIINFTATINRLLGNHVLAGLIFGKYHRPVTERRFVMYLDLAGSTSIAERIGNIAFHSFLNDFFRDISRPVIDWHGDIYKYVGDEAIITWKSKEGVAQQAALEAFFAIRDAIWKRERHYEERYGCVPRFRAGLHYGEVIVGEMGDYKREIAILGDVMNTAARIQSECRSLGVDFLASDEAIRELGPCDARFTLSSRGEASLRGKETRMTLHSVARA